MAIGAGFSHSVFLDVDGRVWTCGRGAGGELGHGDFADQPLPRRVEAGDLHLTRVRKIAVGQHHTVVLTGTRHTPPLCAVLCCAVLGLLCVVLRRVMCKRSFCFCLLARRQEPDLDVGHQPSRPMRPTTDRRYGQGVCPTAPVLPLRSLMCCLCC